MVHAVGSIQMCSNMEVYEEVHAIGSIQMCSNMEVYEDCTCTRQINPKQVS
jgi:hypothetical protein